MPNERVVAELIAGCPLPQRLIIERLRALIHTLHPDVVEVGWQRQRSIGYGFGPRKMSEHYAYLAPFKAHVNLGFFKGALLDDPDRLLEGSGKLLRHIKLRTPEDTDAPGVQRLLTAAISERRGALQRH